MNKTYPGYHMIPFRLPGKRVVCIPILCFFLSLQIHGQSFFYLENKISPSNQPSLMYNTLLVIKPDGNVVSRIRYKNPVDKDDHVVEINLVDSLEPGVKSSGDFKYIIPSGDILSVKGTADSAFIVPRFIFKKQTDSLGYYYTPYAMEISNGGKWFPATMISNEEKTYKELKSFKDTVLLFYDEGDVMYDYMYAQKSRGPAAVRAEKMFLIAVANSIDPTIGASSKKDFDKVTNTFTKLARDLGIKTVIPEYILGNDFSKKAVEKALQNIHPSPADIVIFYYSGHGFRYSDDSSKYPRMSFRTERDPNRIGNNLSVEEVYKQLLKKMAKVTIVMSDCCNEDVGASPRIGTEPLKPRGVFGSLNMENAEKLFFPLNRLSIIIGTADINQLATGNPTIGGFFTHYFISELSQSLYGFDDDDNPGWRNIIDEAKKKATWQALSAFCENTNSRCKQTAVFNVIPPF